MDAIASVLTPIHREGYRFVAIFAVGTLVLFWFAEWLGWIGVVLTLWCAYFFRDPVRYTPTRKGLVISPADGVVQSIEQAAPPPELGMGEAPMTRIAVFMNVFDVHVNRAPLDGQVVRLHYRPGKFLNAALDKASEDNERQSMRLRATGGQEIAVVQIAGLVARRILCEVRENDELAAGQRFGLIRFGSRVDVYLDRAVPVLATTGQRAVAGETVLADLDSGETSRQARAS